MPAGNLEDAFDEAVDALRDLGLDVREPAGSQYPRHRILASEEREYDIVQLEAEGPYALVFRAVENDLGELPQPVTQEDVHGALDFVEDHCMLLRVDTRGLRVDAEVVEFSSRLHLPSADGQTVYEAWKAVDDAYHLYARETDRLFALAEEADGGGREREGGGPPSMHQ